MEIQITNITKKYNGRTVLEIDNLEINKGDLVGLIGNNGAGKTTLFRILLDLVKPDKGTVSLNNKRITRSEEWKTYTSAYLDSSFLIDFLTPEEYFRFILSSFNKTELYDNKMEVFKGLMNNEVLGQNKYIKSFSSGNKQKIGITGCLMTDPGIVILDEPFNYLDPSSQSFLKNYLTDMNRQQDNIIVISSHNLECVYEIATRLILLENGKIIRDYKEINETTKEELKSYFSQSVL